MKTKKLLSILLALMMMLSVVPFYASAAPIALTKSNVKIIPPVAEPAVASYGISYSEIALTGGTLWYVSEDGTETLVPGKFVWTSSGSTNPINVGTVNPGLKFQPDDQTAFSTSGRLSATSTTIVSGEWPTLTILGTPTPRISEVPTVSIVEGITKTYGEATIEGGTAVDKDTNAIIPGKFVVADEYAGMSVVTGEGMRITVRFIPDDLEAYTDMASTVAPVLVKKIYKLVDKNGEEVTVPEFTLPYGTTFDTGGALGVAIKSMIKDRSSLSGADAPFISFPDHDTEEIAPVGTNTYTVRIYPSHEGNSNYKSTYYQFVLTIEPVVITTTAYWSLSDKIGGKVSHEAKGTFDVFVDGKLVADDIKAGGANNEWSFDYPIPATGDYTIKVVYNPIENDPYSMEDYETVVNVRMKRKIILPEDSRVTYKVNGDERTSIMRLGDTIELSTFGGDLFRGWKIADASGNIVDLGVADLMANQITFIMPDYDLYIEAQYEKEVVDDGNGGLDIDNIFGDLDLDNLTQGDSDNPIENLLNNIIDFIKNIIETIISLFRGIGDRT